MTNPLERFSLWWSEYLASSASADTPMCLSTATVDGKPSSRLVLLKKFDKDGSGGFIFFTNYGSRKATELAANPFCALLFSWGDRQVRVEGKVERLSVDENQAYFDTRPHESRVASLASKQSQPMVSEQEFHDRMERLRKLNKLECGSHWGGFRVVPDAIEFWTAGKFRLHDRVIYTRKNNDWEHEKLYP